MFDGKTILLTGGTGSFGQKFVKMTLDRFKPKKIIILSRDEMKQWDMAAQLKREDERGWSRYQLIKRLARLIFMERRNLHLISYLLLRTHILVNMVHLLVLCDMEM